MPSPERQEIVLLECNLDDMTGEELGFVLERLLGEGALDAWFTPIIMKKSRPAVILSALCWPAQADSLTALLLRQTSTLGVRRREMERQVAERDAVSVETPWGPVRCKVKSLASEELSAKPEYDDCARLALAAGIPLRQVQEAALAAYRQLRLG